MDLHVRPNASGTGYVAYDDNGNSAGGVTENEALIAFHAKYPGIEADGVDLAHEPVEMIGTPEQEAKHQAMLDGTGEIDHSHGDDFSACMQYIHKLAARVQALEDMFGGSAEPAQESPATPEAQAEFERMQTELATIKNSLATDWRSFVFQPSHSEVMVISIVPLLRAILSNPSQETLEAIAKWFESIAAEREALTLIAAFLTKSDELPVEVSSAVQAVFGQ